MDKRMWYVYTCKEILFSQDKEGNPALCDNMAEHRGHCATWNESDQDKHCRVSLTCEIQKCQTHSTREQSGGYHGLKDGGNGRVSVKGGMLLDR